MKTKETNADASTLKQKGHAAKEEIATPQMSKEFIEKNTMQYKDGTGIPPSARCTLTGDPLFNVEEVNKLILTHAERVVRDAAEKVQLSLNAYNEIAEQVSKNVDAMGLIMNDASETKKKSIELVRETRKALSYETKLMKEELQVIREFFGEEHHEEHLVRLREIISLTKELEEMRKSGALQALSALAIELA